MEVSQVKTKAKRNEQERNKTQMATTGLYIQRGKRGMKLKVHITTRDLRALK